MRRLNSNRLFLIILYLFTIVVVSNHGMAQTPSESENQTRWWVNICLGRLGELSFSLKKDYLWSIRGSRIAEIPYSRPLFSPKTSTDYWDLGFLVGNEWNEKRMSVSLAGGIALTGVKKPLETEFLTVGIPVDGHVVFTPTSFLGLGFGFFANLNPKESFSQFVFTLRLGSL